MTGIALVAMMTGFLLVYSGFKALDPRCLVQKAFDNTKDCPRIDANEPSPASAALPSGSTAGSAGGGAGTGDKAGWNWQFNNAAANLIKAEAARAAVQARFPSARYAGITNCRKRRGTGADTTQWSVHSVSGAVDFFTSDPNGMIAFAKRLPMVWDAWLDASPGDVHIQVIPNPPANWIPPCARRGAQ